MDPPWKKSDAHDHCYSFKLFEFDQAPIVQINEIYDENLPD